MSLLSAGPIFAAMVLIHQVSTIVLTIVIAGHIVIAIGILPGYRGVWRSMHLSGRVPADVARRPRPGLSHALVVAAVGQARLTSDRACPTVRGRDERFILVPQPGMT